MTKPKKWNRKKSFRRGRKKKDQVKRNVSGESSVSMQAPDTKIQETVERKSKKANKKPKQKKQQSVRNGTDSFFCGTPSKLNIFFI